MKFIIASILIAASSAALAQTGAVSAAKLVPYYQQQRNTALDNLASCAVLVTDLQNRVAELEKQLSEAKAAQSK